MDYAPYIQMDYTAAKLLVRFTKAMIKYVQMVLKGKSKPREYDYDIDTI